MQLFNRHVEMYGIYGNDRERIDLKINSKLYLAVMPVASGGGTPESPTPEIGKIVVENWYYLPWLYTFAEEEEL